MNFKVVILIIAIILLIVSLIVVGYLLYSSKTSGNWPPLVSKCPDYWTDESNNGSLCKNTHTLGSCQIDIKDFSAMTACDKYTWANSCGITWDGITNETNNPCA